MLTQGLERIGVDTDGFRHLNWSKWILIALTLSVAITLGLMGGRQVFRGRTLLEMSILGVAMLILMGLVLYRAELGILAIVITSFFVRFTIPTGTATNIPASLIVAAVVTLLWLLSMLVKRDAKLTTGPYVLPAILFIILAILSVPYSWLLLRPDLFGQGIWAKTESGFTFAQIGGVTLMVLLPTVMLMTASVLRQEKWFKLLFALMIAFAVPDLIQRITNVRLGIGDLRLQTGQAYALWVVALSMAQVYFNQNLRLWQRGLLLALAALWIYRGAEGAAVWFSGWMPSVVAVLFLTFFRSKKLLLVLLAAGVILVITRFDFYYHYLLDDAIKSDSNRFEIWQIIVFDLTLTKTNIFFGAGPAGYLPFYQKYYPGAAWVSHNNYIDILAEMGVVGVSVFLWLLYSIFHVGLAQRNQMPTGFLRGFNYGVLGGFVGSLFAMGLGDWFIPFVYNIGIPGFDFAVYGWILAGAMLALYHLKPREPVHAHSNI
jgi:hypothetical protein